MLGMLPLAAMKKHASSFQVGSGCRHILPTIEFQVKFVLLVLREGMLVDKMDNEFNEKQKFHAIIS